MYNALLLTYSKKHFLTKLFFLQCLFFLYLHFRSNTHAHLRVCTSAHTHTHKTARDRYANVDHSNKTSQPCPLPEMWANDSQLFFHWTTVQKMPSQKYCVYTCDSRLTHANAHGHCQYNYTQTHTHRCAHILSLNEAMGAREDASQMFYGSEVKVKPKTEVNVLMVTV